MTIRRLMGRWALPTACLLMAAVTLAQEVRVNGSTGDESSFAADRAPWGFQFVWDSWEFCYPRSSVIRSMAPSGTFITDDIDASGGCIVDSTSDVAVSRSGTFTVVDVGGDGSYGSIAAQMFNPDGRPITPVIQVNQEAKGDQGNPHVAALANGSFAVMWWTPGKIGGFGRIVMPDG